MRVGFESTEYTEANCRLYGSSQEFNLFLNSQLPRSAASAGERFRVDNVTKSSTLADALSFLMGVKSLLHILEIISKLSSKYYASTEHIGVGNTPVS